MPKLRIVVASMNPVKRAAVEAAFAVQFPGAPLELQPLQVDSGVSDQPMSESETRQGARNRARAARERLPNADYWVGLEGGLEDIGGALTAFAWMHVVGPDGRSSEARSATLPMPPAVQRLVDQGLELGHANDRVFATVNSKHQGGAFGLLTQGRYTREAIYQQTLVLALIPFVHPLWRGDEPGAG